MTRLDDGDLKQQPSLSSKEYKRARIREGYVNSGENQGTQGISTERAQ